MVPWEDTRFRDGLAVLSASTAAASRRCAADVRVLASLAAMVPRCLHDDRGATPWTSFRREVAVAQSLTDAAAAALIRHAVRLTTALPVMLGLLESGQATVERARTLDRELEPHDDEVARHIDTTLSAKVALMAPWRIAQEVRRAVLVHDPDAAAQRASVKSAARGIELTPDADDQASLLVYGPAVPLTRWHATLDEQARGLKQAGDPRTLSQLRFDLATSTFPCTTHAPADSTTTSSGARVGAEAGEVVTFPFRPEQPDASGGLRPSFVEAASTDCRRGRPVRVNVLLPVETALGLSNEPGWVDGYGWLSAPASRQLLVDAELRALCTDARTGQALDLARTILRPPPTPHGVRAALLDLVLDEQTLTGIADRPEPQHDPSEPLREFVVLRDRACDGPGLTRTPASSSARRSQLDHDTPYPVGPTAAWNLAARADRTHGLKHSGWTPLRTAAGTLWTSPAGQLVMVPSHTSPPPGVDIGPGPAVLPDPDDLDLLDRAQLEDPPDETPYLPWDQRDTTTWTWLDQDGADGIAC